MNRKSTLFITLLTLLPGTYSNAMEITKSTIQEHRPDLIKFVKKIEQGKKIEKGISWLPGAKSLITLSASFLNYDKEDLENSAVLDRFFAHSEQRQHALGSLGTEEDAAHLNTVFTALKHTDGDRKKLIQIIHEKHLESLQKEPTVTKSELKEIVQEKDESDNYVVKDQDYFTNIARSLYAIFFHEKTGKNETN